MMDSGSDSSEMNKIGSFENEGFLGDLGKNDRPIDARKETLMQKPAGDSLNNTLMQHLNNSELYNERVRQETVFEKGHKQPQQMDSSGSDGDSGDSDNMMSGLGSVKQKRQIVSEMPSKDSSVIFFAKKSGGLMQGLGNQEEFKMNHDQFGQFDDPLDTSSNEADEIEMEKAVDFTDSDEEEDMTVKFSQKIKEMS